VADEDVTDGLTAVEIQELADQGAFGEPGAKICTRDGPRGRTQEDESSSGRDSEGKGYRGTSREPLLSDEERTDDRMGEGRAYTWSRHGGFECLLDRCGNRFSRMDDLEVGGPSWAGEMLRSTHIDFSPSLMPLQVHQDAYHRDAPMEQRRRRSPIADRSRGEDRGSLSDTSYRGRGDSDSHDADSDASEPYRGEVGSSRNRLSKPSSRYDKRRGKQPQSRLAASSHARPAPSKLSKMPTNTSSRGRSKNAYHQRSAGFFEGSSRNGSSSQRKAVKSRPRPLVYTRPGWPRKLDCGPYMSGALAAPSEASPDGRPASNRVGSSLSDSEGQWESIEGFYSYEEPGPSNQDNMAPEGSSEHAEAKRPEEISRPSASSSHDVARIQDQSNHSTDDEDFQAAIQASLRDLEPQGSATPPVPNVVAPEPEPEPDNTSEFYLLGSDQVWKLVAGIFGHADSTPTNMISLAKLTQLGYDARQIDTSEVLGYAVDFNQEARTLGSIGLWYTTLHGPPGRKPTKLTFEVFDAANFPWDVILRGRGRRGEGNGKRREGEGMPISFGEWIRLRRGGFFFYNLTDFRGGFS
jgi:hypothetical protein